MTLTDADPKGLIRESYRIEGITPAECRSIFIDWALSLAKDQDSAAALLQLLNRYGTDNPDHPMTEILKAACVTPPSPVRRGGRAARLNRQQG